MNVTGRIIGTLALVAALAPVHRASADPAFGRWRVRSSSARTLTLDGSETLKGPFVDRPTNTWITMSANRYILDDDGTTTTYALRRSGRDYVLSRKSEDGSVTIRLTRVTVSGRALRFTSTRTNRSRQEQYVVQWVCERPTKAGAKKQAPRS